MKRFCSGTILLFGLSLFGCGSTGGGAAGEFIPVVGNIKIDDLATGNVTVSYQPTGTTTGNGGVGVTDSTGRYEVKTPQGKKGLPVGDYKVTVSLRLNPDGSAPDPNTPPIESQAREMMAAKYSDLRKTELTVKINAGDSRSFDFSLNTTKKK